MSALAFARGIAGMEYGLHTDYVPRKTQVSAPSRFFYTTKSMFCVSMPKFIQIDSAALARKGNRQSYFWFYNIRRYTGCCFQ